MNPRIIVLAIAALVVAGLTAFLVRIFLQGSGEEEQVVDTDTTAILVANSNLPMGHLVEPNDLRWQEWPNDSIHANYLTQDEAEIEALNGYVVRFGITGGEPATRERMVGPGQKGFLAAVLGPDMRAVTIPVNRTSGIAGFIFPGDRVDIILSRIARDESGISHQVGETVLKNIRILAVDLRVNDQNKGNPALGKSVTIEVTPKMAEKVAMLTRMGRLSLALRSLRMEGGQTIEVFSPDDSAPISNQQTHTWDAEVSRLSPPINPPREVLTITRGRQNQVFVIDGSELLGEDDVRFAEDADSRDDDEGDN
jgi:pilus assembly protein CpaB